MGNFLDVLLALAVVVLPLLLVWYLIGRGLDSRSSRSSDHSRH